MVPAFGMVILPQNPSTENGHVPGCSWILSVGVSCTVVAHYCWCNLAPNPVDRHLRFALERAAEGAEMSDVHGCLVEGELDVGLGELLAIQRLRVRWQCVC